MAACASAPTKAKVEEAPFFRLPIAASADSAVKLVRFALGEVNGAIQPARIQRDVIVISTQYTRQRHNGGHTQITIFGAIDRKPARLDPLTTMVELSAWGMDEQPSSTRMAMVPGSRLPTLQTTSPTTVASAQYQPYRITRGDTLYWSQLEDVLNALIDLSTKKP